MALRCGAPPTAGASGGRCLRWCGHLQPAPRGKPAPRRAAGCGVHTKFGVHATYHQFGETVLSQHVAQRCAQEGIGTLNEEMALAENFTVQITVALLRSFHQEVDDDSGGSSAVTG